MNVIDNIGKITSNNIDVKNKNTVPSPVVKLPESKTDTFEKQTAPKKAINKKLIIAGVAFGAAAITAFAFRKNIASVINKALKPSVSGIENSAKSQTNHLQERAERSVETAKTFMIDDAKNKTSNNYGGVCFWGVDSIGKKEKMEEFIKSLSDSGYVIKRMPVVEEVTAESIENFSVVTEKAIDEAEALFKETGKRTAIIVKNLDKVAQDRNKNPLMSTSVSTLLRFEQCINRGYTWVSDAVNVKSIDPAVLRAGRLGNKILCPPTAKDPKSVWTDFLETTLKKQLPQSENTDKLIAETVEQMKKLFE